MRRLIPLLFLAVALVSFASPAYACSCMAADPAQMLEFGPIAFVGTVSGAGAAAGTTSLTFEVDTVLAGEVPAQVQVFTAGDSAACGIEAAVGTRIAVFANDEGGMLTSDLCSTTDAESALDALGPGTSPSGTSVETAPFDWPAVWLGAGAITLVGAGWLVTRRR